jgi:hypothetical protein
MRSFAPKMWRVANPPPLPPPVSPGTPATRIELVDVADLTTPNVPRRGVFQWEDTIRQASATRHAIQKIHVTGATHFPAFA